MFVLPKYAWAMPSLEASQNALQDPIFAQLLIAYLEFIIIPSLQATSSYLHLWQLDAEREWLFKVQAVGYFSLVWHTSIST